MIFPGSVDIPLSFLKSLKRIAKVVDVEFRRIIVSIDLAWAAWMTQQNLVFKFSVLKRLARCSKRRDTKRNRVGGGIKDNLSGQYVRPIAADFVNKS